MNNRISFFRSLLLCISFILIFFSCKNDDEDAPPISNPGNTFVIDISGSIITENGMPLASAMVELNGKMALTDNQGVFRILNASANQGRNFVAVKKEGYFFGGKNIYVNNSNDVRVKVKLLPRVLIGTINSSVGGSVSSSEGLEVDLPANAIAGGFSGSVKIYADYIDPSGNEASLEIPGLEAIDQSNVEGILESFGMAHIELEDDNGNKLDLAEGVEASLTFPIPAEVLAAAPAEIPLWFFDEDEGIWKEEGSATLSGDKYTGQVSHFSFWNCDDFICGYVATIQALCEESGLENLMVILDPQFGGLTPAGGLTNQNGIVSGLIPCDYVFDAYIIQPGEEDIVYSLGSFSSADFTEADTIVLNTACPQFSIVQGCVQNADGSAVTNGYIYFEFDGYLTESTFLDDNGCFTATAYDFLGNATETTITAWNLDIFQFGQSEPIPFNDQLNVLDIPIVIGGGTIEVEGLLFSASISDTMYCINAANGNKVWEKYVGAFVRGCAPVFHNNRIYFGTEIGEFFCLNAFDGSEIWTTQVATIQEDINTPVIEDDVLYMSSTDGFVYAIDANSGSELWSSFAGTAANKGPTVSGDYVYCGTGFGNGMKAFDKVTGAEIWNYTTGDDVQSNPSVVDGRVYFLSYDQKAYALDALTGELVWETEIDSENFLISSPTVQNGVVYTHSNSKITALEANTGSIIWQTSHDPILSPIIQYMEGSIYTLVRIGNGGLIQALNPNNGKVLWEEDIDIFPTGIVGANGVIFHGHDQEPDPFVSRNANNGEIIWISSNDDGAGSIPTYVDDNGFAHYVSESGMKQ